MLAQVAGFCDLGLLTFLAVLCERGYEIGSVEDVGDVIRVQPEVGGLLGASQSTWLHTNKETASTTASSEP
jgi:hypothetical protein